MKVRIVLEPGRQEPEAVLYAGAVTEEIRDAERLLQGRVLNGYSGDYVTRLPVSSILRIYGETQKVYAQTERGIYQLRQRLYELEAFLDPAQFLRISNSEIVNSDAIRRLDISLTGTIDVELEGGIHSFASRRYVKKIKEALGI